MLLIPGSKKIIMSVVDMLRENNPARTDISIWLRYAESDADLAGALAQNPFVTEIELNLSRRAESQIGILCCV